MNGNEPLTSTPTTAYNKNLASSTQKAGFQFKPLDNMYMKEYSYTVEERTNERSSQFSPKHLGGFNYTGDRQDGENLTPLSSPQDKSGGRPGYKHATATAFTYKPPEITRTTIPISSTSTRPLSTYRSAMNANTTTATSPSANKSSTLPASRLKESQSAYSWLADNREEDRVRSEKAEERQFAQLINTKDVSKEGKKEKSASTDKMNALFGTGKSKSKFGSSSTSSTEKQSSTTKSSIFSSFLKSSDEKIEKKKQLSQSTSNVLDQKKTSSTSSLINKYNNLTSSPKVIGSGQLRQPMQQHEQPKQTKLDSDSESASSSENSMDEYASDDLKTDPITGLTIQPTATNQVPSYLTSSKLGSTSLPRNATNNLVGRSAAQRFEPQPTVRTSLTMQPSTFGNLDFTAATTSSKPPIASKPAIPTKPSALTNKVSPYETTISLSSPIASRTNTLLNNNTSYLKDNFLKDKTPPLTSKPQVPIKLQTAQSNTLTQHHPQHHSPSYLTSSSSSPKTSSNLNSTSMYNPYNNALITTTTIPHVQPKITHLSRKRTVKNADGSIQEDEEILEPSSRAALPQTYVSTATFTPSKPVGALPAAAANRSPNITRYNHTYNNKLVL